MPISTQMHLHTFGSTVTEPSLVNFKTTSFIRFVFPHPVAATFAHFQCIDTKFAICCSSQCIAYRIRSVFQSVSRSFVHIIHCLLPIRVWNELLRFCHLLLFCTFCTYRQSWIPIKLERVCGLEMLTIFLFMIPWTRIFVYCLLFIVCFFIRAHICTEWHFRMKFNSLYKLKSFDQFYYTTKFNRNSH